jgi:hypothetical protein
VRGRPLGGSFVVRGPLPCSIAHIGVARSDRIMVDRFTYFL